jgi:integrase
MAWAAKVEADPAKRGRQSQGGSGPTVEQALRDYAEAKRRQGQIDRAGEALTVLRRHVPAPLRSQDIATLFAGSLKVWLASLNMSQGRADKVRGVLRAALRAAGCPDSVVRDGLSASAMPQRSAPATRDVIPTRDEVTALIAAMQNIDADLALFMEGLALTGARPSQLARCRLADLDVPGGFLTIPASNKGRAGIRKTTRGVAFPIGHGFAEQLARAADRDTGLLFHTAKLEQDFGQVSRARLAASGVGDTWREVGRTVWSTGLWVRKVRAAVAAAGLDPDVTLYALRHTRIIALIQGGMALREIAGLLDTSAAMIERAYTKHIAGTDATTARLRRLLEAETAAVTSPG